MPLFSTRGAASAKGFGLTGGAGGTPIDYLVVAGGGGGGAPNGGGGGAGGVRFSKYGPAPLNGATLKLKDGIYPVVVGGGGTQGTYIPSSCGTRGNPSSFDTITSTGGGRGNPGPGNPGGSGGGLPGCDSGFGTGNTPPTSPPQGNNGGNAIGPTGNLAAGAGGGATAVGASGCATPSATGGAGAEVTITGSPVIYGGGGGTGARNCGLGSVRRCGGPGGGGPGGVPGNGTPGTDGLGGGGGGSGFFGGNNRQGGAGGSGIVIVRAPSTKTLTASPPTNTVSTLPAPAGGCKVATFTVSGDLTIA